MNPFLCVKSWFYPELGLYDHMKTLQRIHDRRLFFRCTLRHTGIFILRQIIILTHLQSAFPFDLGNKEG